RPVSAAGVEVRRHRLRTDPEARRRALPEHVPDGHGDGPGPVRHRFRRRRRVRPGAGRRLLRRDVGGRVPAGRPGLNAAPLHAPPRAVTRGADHRHPLMPGRAAGVPTVRKVLYLLGHLSDTDVEWMMDAGRTEHVPAGTVLIREGQPVNALYLLLDGAL